jgi:hypothetical protein
MPQGTIDQLGYLTHIQGNMKRLDIMQCIFNSIKKKKKKKSQKLKISSHEYLVNRCGGWEYMDWAKPKGSLKIRLALT